MTAPEHPTVRLARLACAALTLALDTERRAADEVEARGGERSARGMLDINRVAAVTALYAFLGALPAAKRCEHRAAIAQMVEAVDHGYARAKWTLWIMQIAAASIEGATYCTACDKWGVIVREDDGRHALCGGVVTKGAA